MLDCVDRWMQGHVNLIVIFFLLLLLFSWCFEPSQPQRITSGLNKNFTLSPSYSFHKSSYHKSCFGGYLYSAGTQHGKMHPAGWPILFCRPTQEPELATANTGKKSGEILDKCTWMDQKGRNKQAKNPWQYAWLYTDLPHATKGERLSPVFSPDGTLISASADPHCG